MAAGCGAAVVGGLTTGELRDREAWFGGGRRSFWDWMISGCRRLILPPCHRMGSPCARDGGRMYGRGKTVPKQNATSTSKLLLYTEGSGEERTNVEKETLTSESMGKKPHESQTMSRGVDRSPPHRIHVHACVDPINEPSKKSICYLFLDCPQVF